MNPVTAVGLLLVALVVVWAIWDGAREEKRETEILAMLLVYRDMYGLEMVRASEGIGGKGLLRRGTIYITLGRLEQQGFVSSVEEVLSPFKRAAGCIPRRIYSITPSGRVEALTRAELAGAPKKAS